MPVRDSVRERRQKRISQLLDQYSQPQPQRQQKEEAESPQPPQMAEPFFAGKSPQPPRGAELLFDNSQPPQAAEPLFAGKSPELDPELWWKEREKQVKTEDAHWQGMRGLPPAASSRSVSSFRTRGFHPFIRGFAWRVACSALIFAAAWGWFEWEMPGSAETRDWMVSSMTRDMDFQSIEVWYSNTFDGSPSFFSFHQDKTNTKEASVPLTPDKTALPVQGRVVQSFAQSGTGLKVAASGGSHVQAVFTGRVRQVTQEQGGGITILVQHANGVLTVYGNLAKSFVKSNDWVETGQTLGQLESAGNKEGLLYFAVQQNGKTVNPADVVTFD